MRPLKEGMEAPDFELRDQDSKLHTLKCYGGKKIVLYFYPKDMTPGCTKEACSFRDDFSEYKKRGIVVLGISADTSDSHKRFTDKHKLPFTLLADTNRDVVKRYGVYGEKKFMGKTFRGINRTTFLINEEGKIIKIYPKVDVGRHSKEILEFFDRH